MLQGQQSFLEKIRNSDISTKRRWVVGASIAAMAIVLLLWLSYLNSIIKPTAITNQTSSTDETTQEFWPVMRRGVAIMSSLTKDKIRTLISNIMAGHSITIDNNQ